MFIELYLVGCIVAFVCLIYDWVIKQGNLNFTDFILCCLGSLLSWLLVFLILFFNIEQDILDYKIKNRK